MTRKCQVRFWRAVEGVTPSLTLIIEKVGMGHRHDSKRTQRECKTEVSVVPDEVLRITEAMTPGEYVNILSSSAHLPKSLRVLFLDCYGKLSETNK